MPISRRALLAASPAMVLPGAARAAAPVRGVVELFTSQGCSSCPPADRLAAVLARDPGLVVLSFAVDYWDGLGWRDTFAQHAFTRRQYAYAEGRGDGEVYTPQAVVNGADHAVGSDRRGILALAGEPLPVIVGIGQEIALAGTSLAPGGERASVVAVSFLRSREVAIGRGENDGARVTYTNIVRSIVRLGTWPGGRASFGRPDVTVDADQGLAVLVQQGGIDAPGRIIGAAIV